MSPGSTAFVYLGAEENLCRWYEHSGLGAGEPRKHGERQLFRPARSGPASPLPASSRRNQPFGFMSKLRHWANGLQRRVVPVDGVGGRVSVGLGGRICIIMGGYFE